MWKKQLCSIVAAGALVLCGYTGLAFDMRQDAVEFTKDPAVMVTLYLGMPMIEEEANFAGATQWTKTERKGGWSLEHSYSRSEPTEYKGISKVEYVWARYYDGSNNVSQVGVAFWYTSGDKKTFESPRPKGLKGNDVKKLNSDLKGIGDKIYAQMVSALGQPTTSGYNKNADMKLQGYTVTWGKPHGDPGFQCEWDFPHEKYRLFITTYYNGNGVVSVDHSFKR